MAAIADLDGNTKQMVDLFSEQKFKRQSAEHYQNQDPEKADKEFEKMKAGALQLLFASLKNKDPFDDNSSSGADEILQVNTSITQLTSAQFQLRNSNQVVEAIKNPGYSAAELQGMEVEYDDSTRDFNGKDSVIFNYNLEYDKKYENNKTANIKTTIDIKDSKGHVVHSTKGGSKQGMQTFTWNGKDSLGKKLPPGEYKIFVRAAATIRDENNNESPMVIKASTRLSGIVTSVEIEKGLTTNVNLDNGASVKKSNINIIGEKKRKDIAHSTLADINMIGHEVDLDLSKFQIKNGAAEISYKNTVKNANPGAKVEIFDEKSRKVKSVDLDYALNNGYGTLSLKSEISNLADGNYTAKITLTDKDDQKITLDSKESLIVKGIKKDSNKIISLEGDEFNAHTIISTKGANFQSPLQQIETAFLKKTVKYPDDKFIASRDDFEISLDMPMMENGGMLYDANINIYNENNDLVSVVRKPINLYELLTDGAKDGLEPFMEGNGINPADISKDNHLEINKHIKRMIDADSRLVKEMFKDREVGDKLAKGQITIDLSWDGKFGNTAPKPGAANPGEKYRFEVLSSFKDDRDNLSTKRYDYLTEDIVQEVTREDGEYYLHFASGDVIPYTKVVEVVDDKVK